MKDILLKYANTKDSRFEDLGSLKELCEKYGGVGEVRIENSNEQNLLLILKTKEEFEMRLLCSIGLSKIISESDSFSKDFLDYRVLRITENNGQKYIRVSQNIEIKGDPNIDIMTQIELSKKIKGNKMIIYHASDLESEPYVPKKYNIDDLIKY